MQLLCAATTDPGLVRQRNEDRFLADGDLGLFLVVDGMGGYAAGELASATVADASRRSSVKPPATRTGRGDLASTRSRRRWLTAAAGHPPRESNAGRARAVRRGSRWQRRHARGRAALAATGDRSPEEICGAAISAANARGGPDNPTAVLIEAVA